MSLRHKAAVFKASRTFPALACMNEGNALLLLLHQNLSHPEKGAICMLSFVIEVISASNQSADGAAMCRRFRRFKTVESHQSVSSAIHKRYVAGLRHVQERVCALEHIAGEELICIGAGWCTRDSRLRGRP